MKSIHAIRVASAIALTAMIVVLVAPTAWAEEAAPESTAVAGDASESSSQEIGSPISDDLMRAEVSAPETTITFSEVALETMIEDQYQNQGIHFGGDGLFVDMVFTTTDGANPTSPVLSGSPRFQGDIPAKFVTASGAPRTVDHFSVDVGYIDNPGEVAIDIFSSLGGVIRTQPITGSGIVTVDVNEPGMGGFRVHTVGNEAAGWAIDNVTFSSSTALPETYVALGDSFQSGEGAYDYEYGTDLPDSNLCHRSANAYPELLVERGVVELPLDFAACSGATISDMGTDDDGTGQTEDEAAQLSNLTTETKLVTIGVVGNDLNFGAIVKACITSSLLNWGSSCEHEQGAAVDSVLAEIEDGQLRADLRAVYRAVQDKAPSARVIVVSYPRFFSEVPKRVPDNCGWVGRIADQQWMNAAVKRADDAIGEIVASVGFEYVNMFDAFDDHEQCTEKEAMNGIIGNLLAPATETYHPNKYGHEIMAGLVGAQIGETIAPTFTINPGQSIRQTFTVDGRTFSVTTKWPGSDVSTTLTSPSGQVYSRENTNGAEHVNGATSENWLIDDPEPGDWTIDTFGLDVAEGGEPVVLLTNDENEPNQMPDAVIGVQNADGSFAFDAGSSHDDDGTLVDYLWDFGDGTSSTEIQVSHTYTTPGTYTPALVITDNAGGKGFATSDPITIVADNVPESIGLRVGSTVALTNKFHIADGDLEVAGDFECNSEVQTDGDVRVAGKVHLTNNCTIRGDLHAGGSVNMDSTSRVLGSVTSAGNVKVQSTAHIGGSLVAGGTVTKTDGGSANDLLGGAVAGPITQHGSVDIPTIGTRTALNLTPELTWPAWMNSLAAQNGAPSWSQGLTAKPGCVIAPWASSINSNVIDAANVVIDARKGASGCSKVSLQSMTMRLSGDVTLLADGFSSINGLRIESADGQPHKLTVSTTGASSCGNTAVELSSGTITDDLSQFDVTSDGKVAIHGTSSIRGTFDVQCVVANGDVQLTAMR